MDGPARRSVASTQTKGIFFHRSKKKRKPEKKKKREKGKEKDARETACDGSIAAVEIEITRLSAHPSYRDGRHFPLKVHQTQANPFRLPPPGSPFHPRRTDLPDGIISSVVMIIAQHRAVSHRIASSRPENWLFSITMTSLSLSYLYSPSPCLS